MKTIQWLMTLTNDKNPLKLAVALLLICVAVLATVVKYQENKLVLAEQHRRDMQYQYDRRADSIIVAAKLREDMLNAKVEEVLGSLIEDYKKQLEEKNNLKTLLNSTLKENNKVLFNNKSQIKSLSR